MDTRKSRREAKAVATTVLAYEGYALRQIPVASDVGLATSLADRYDRKNVVRVVRALAHEFLDLHRIVGVPISTLDRIHIRESPLEERKGMEIVNLIERNDELIARLRGASNAGPKLEFSSSLCFAYGESESCQCSYCYQIDVKTHG